MGRSISRRRSAPTGRASTRAAVRARVFVCAALGCGAAAACVVGGRFECNDDLACRDGNVQGTCEAAGYCSFPDDTCASGARFSRFAPAALAEDCVERSATSSESTGSTSTIDPGTSSDGGPQPDAGPPAVRTPHEVTCGDGLVEGDEACDDENLADADGCNHDCVLSGSPLWTVIENGQAGGDDIAYGVALMPDGDVVATGRTAGDAGDAWMARFDPATGESLRAWQYGTAQPDEGRAIATDADSQIYVAGTSFTDATLTNGFLKVYYDDLLDGGMPDGNVTVRWSRTVNSAMAADDGLRAVAIRGEDEVVGAGSLGHADAPDHPDAYARGFAVADGTNLWSSYVGIDGFGNQAWAITVTADGRTFVGGSVRTANNNARTDAWLGELDLMPVSGNVGYAWTQRIGTLGTNEVINALAQTPDGALLAAGHLANHGFWSTWSTDGVEGERRVADDEQESEIRGIAADETGAVVTVGQHESALGMLDIEVVKYDPAGAVLWRDVVDGDAHGDDRAHAVVIADDGTIVVAGQARAPASDSDIWLRKYAP